MVAEGMAVQPNASTEPVTPGQKADRPHPGAPRAGATRIIAAGSAALMDGFRLAGIEVMPDADAAQLEALLKNLVTGKQRALVLVEAYLLNEPGPWLHRVQSEGGRVVVMLVPSLGKAGEYHPEVDRLIGLAGTVA